MVTLITLQMMQKRFPMPPTSKTQHTHNVYQCSYSTDKYEVFNNKKTVDTQGFSPVLIENTYSGGHVYILIKIRTSPYSKRPVWRIVLVPKVSTYCSLRLGRSSHCGHHLRPADVLPREVTVTSPYLNTIVE